MREFLRKHRNKKGFTIIELVVVIIVIGILFVAFISKTDNTTDKAKEVGVKSIFRSYQTAAETVMREQSGLKDMTVEQIVTELNRNLDKPLEITYVAEVNTAYVDASHTATGAGKAAATNVSCTITFEDEWNMPYRVIISPANNFIAFYSDGANATNETGAYVADPADKIAYNAPAVPETGDTITINSAVGMSNAAAGATNEDDYMLIVGYNQGTTLTATEGFSSNQ